MTTNRYVRVHNITPEHLGALRENGIRATLSAYIGSFEGNGAEADISESAKNYEDDLVLYRVETGNQLSVHFAIVDVVQRVIKGERFDNRIPIELYKTAKANLRWDVDAREIDKATERLGALRVMVKKTEASMDRAEVRILKMRKVKDASVFTMKEEREYKELIVLHDLFVVEEKLHAIEISRAAQIASDCAERWTVAGLVYGNPVTD